MDKGVRRSHHHNEQKHNNQAPKINSYNSTNKPTYITYNIINMAPK